MNALEQAGFPKGDQEWVKDKWPEAYNVIQAKEMNVVRIMQGGVDAPSLIYLLRNGLDEFKELFTLPPELQTKETVSNLAFKAINRNSLAEEQERQKLVVQLKPED